MPSLFSFNLKKVNMLPLMLHCNALFDCDKGTKHNLEAEVGFVNQDEET